MTSALTVVNQIDIFKQDVCVAVSTTIYKSYSLMMHCRDAAVLASKLWMYDMFIAKVNE